MNSLMDDKAPSICAGGRECSCSLYVHSIHICHRKTIQIFMDIYVSIGFTFDSIDMSVCSIFFSRIVSLLVSLCVFCLCFVSNKFPFFLSSSHQCVCVCALSQLARLSSFDLEMCVHAFYMCICVCMCVK